MFDIGFFELIVVALVGLFVIGPERLPGTIRTGALWFGRIKRNLLDTRRELEKHIGADEIRRELHNEQIMHNLAKMKDSRDQLAKKIQEWQDGDFKSENPDQHAEHDETHSHHDEIDEPKKAQPNASPDTYHDRKPDS